MSQPTCALCENPTSPLPNIPGYCTPHLHFLCHALRRSSCLSALAESEATVEEARREVAPANIPPYLSVLTQAVDRLKELMADDEQDFKGVQKSKNEAAMLYALSRWRTSDVVSHHFLPVTASPPLSQQQR